MDTVGFDDVVVVEAMDALQLTDCSNSKNVKLTGVSLLHSEVHK